MPQPGVAPAYAAPTYAAPTYAVPNYPAPSPALAAYPNTSYPAAPAYPSYPNTAAPMAQPVPRPAYYEPYPAAPSYPPQYGYAAQPPATAMYQPYQAGSQYRYPSPYSRPPVQMMAAAGQGTVGQQPMPAPPPGPSPAPSPEYGPLAEPPAAQGGMMNQMLADPNYYGGDGCGPCGPYRGAVGAIERAACNPGGDGCGYDGCQSGFCGQWYAGVSALVLGRSDAPRFWVSYREGCEGMQLMNSQFSMQWAWGGEVTFGRRFCCDCVPYAIEATYWTTSDMTGSQCADLARRLRQHAADRQVHRFQRRERQGLVHGRPGAAHHTAGRGQNLEVNLIREQLAWACDSCWDIGWSVGIRYFRFREDLDFETLRQGCQWTDPAATACLDENVTNNLIGVQFGFDAAYCLGCGVRFFISPKVGIYDNFMDSTFQCNTGDGIEGHTANYGSFPACGTKNGLAFLTQIDVGLDWRFSRCWSARVGYRVVAVTGVALADSQFPQYMNDIPEIQNIQHTDSLVLHGAFCGITYNF